MLGTSGIDGYVIGAIAVTLAALAITLAVDHRRSIRKPPKGPYWERAVIITLYFIIIVFPLVGGIPVLVADMMAARRLAHDSAQQKAASGPATSPTSRSWASGAE